MPEILTRSAPGDWRPLDPENTLYLELAAGRVIIELAPDFAPRHVANVKALAREKYFDGLAILRVQDNYVAQWGDPDAEAADKARKIKSAQRHLPSEFDRSFDPSLAFTALPDRDAYAPEVGFSKGFPVARDPANGRMWLVHAYGMVGAGRDVAIDSGGGTELYAVIGHAPRHLDRNVTLLGRVVQGIELLSSLPRGPGAMGFYERADQRVPIRSVRVAADVPPAERASLELLRTDTPLFSQLIEARRNRQEEWFHLAAGRIEIGNVPLPVRTAAPAAPKSSPEVVSLWPGDAPDENGGIGPERTRPSPSLTRVQVEVTNSTRMITGVTKPTMTIYRSRPEKDTGTVVVICPGGGYWDLYWELEGEEVAEWLNAHGITGVILKYRVPRRPDEPKTEPARRPLQDAQRAVRLLRSRTAELGIRHLGVMGFSAGGHLAAASATEFGAPAYAPVDDKDGISCRPDFAVAVYPGYLKQKAKDELAPYIHIPPATAPIFLVHGSDDIISPPEQSLLFYLALKRSGVPTELHIYANTSHDFGVRRNQHAFSKWTDSCLEWMRELGFLEDR